MILTKQDDLERLCDAGARLGLPQLPIFRAAADGLLALLRIEAPDTPWPARMIERQSDRPTCIMLAADPGCDHPDPGGPADWACAKRLKYWCQTGGAIIHGAAGDPDHYRAAAATTVLLRRMAFIECASARAREWTDFLGCPRSLTIVPEHGAHPVPEPRGAVH
jgi:hypothetical protein